MRMPLNDSVRTYSKNISSHS